MRTSAEDEMLIGGGWVPGVGGDSILKKEISIVIK